MALRRNGRAMRRRRDVEVRFVSRFGSIMRITAMSGPGGSEINSDPIRHKFIRFSDRRIRAVHHAAHLRSRGHSPATAIVFSPHVLGVLAVVRCGGVALPAFVFSDYK
jgi:hypothetical protein